MNGAYTFSGFAVGLLVGVTGVGGGSLMTPLLVFLFGFKPAVAVGTDLLFAAITKPAAYGCITASTAPLIGKSSAGWPWVVYLLR